MLRAVVVHLQREAGARFHGDALDLEARALVDAVVGAPGAVHPAVALGLGAGLLHQVPDQLLDLLHAVLVGDHHGVLGLHHHHVVQADQGDQLVLAVDQAVAAVLQHDVAARDVAGGVLALDLPERGPGADVAPAGVQGHHAGAVGVFHHGVVDGVVGAVLEARRVDAEEAEVLLAAGQGRLAGLVDAGLVLLEFLQVAAGTEQEHAAVPEVLALLDEAPGRGQVGLLDEAFHRQHAFGQAIAVGGGADVAVPGLRAGRRYPKKHQGALLGRQPGACQGTVEGLDVVDDVVGRQHQQQFVTPGLEQRQRSNGHGRRGVAAEGFQQDGLGLPADARQLVGDDEAVGFVADHHRRLEPFEGQALHGLLEQGVLTDQGEKLFRVLLAR